MEKNQHKQTCSVCEEKTIEALYKVERIEGPFQLVTNNESGEEYICVGDTAIIAGGDSTFHGMKGALDLLHYGHGEAFWTMIFNIVEFITNKNFEK